MRTVNNGQAKQIDNKDIRDDHHDAADIKECGLQGCANEGKRMNLGWWMDAALKSSA
jgi:hypothetical protein